MKVGRRLKSAVCTTQVVIVRAGDVTLECGGRVMGDGSAPVDAGGPPASFDGGSQLGKRYVDEESGTEVLCVQGGHGALSVDGRLLDLKVAKALPASD